jgi:DNA polymerase-3 subunit epsilon
VVLPRDLTRGTLSRAARRWVSLDPGAAGLIARNVGVSGVGLRSLTSICQVGVARYVDGKFHEWKTYIDPEDYFAPFNVHLHGISEEKVAGAPTFRQVAPDLLTMLRGATVVSHGPFDRSALTQACDRAGIAFPPCQWLDTCCVARRTWSGLQDYRLPTVCDEIGYDYEAHDALEDAKAAAHVLLAASERTGLGIEQWIDRVKRPVSGSRRAETIRRDGNPEGPLYGEVVVFTGKLSFPRPAVADLASSKLGLAVATGVTKKTTLLVVGDQDIAKLAGHDKSEKHRKAEDLIQAGQQIRIVCERDFMHLLALATPEETSWTV